MIQPGLARISKLLANTPLPWRAIHVAGTNGKGSVCNYAASMLDIYSREQFYEHTGHSDLTWAKFTSPHLVDRWDGIVVNGETISKTAFEQIEAEVLDFNAKEAVKASEFEILTATAFKAFTAAKVDIGIVEVGMGGKEDATNLLGTVPSVAGVSPAHSHSDFRAPPLVTAICKIGLDHQAFLGDNILDIARHKAGIMKNRVPVVYDESNESEVKLVMKESAADVVVRPTTVNDFNSIIDMIVWSYLPAEERPIQVEGPLSTTTPAHVQQNTSVALRSVLVALSQLHRVSNQSELPASALRHLLQKMSAVGDMSTTPNPGRLERLEMQRGWPFQSEADQPIKVLLDGAHNAQSAVVLGKEVAKLRQEQESNLEGCNLTWVLGISSGKDVDELLKPLLQPGDSVFAVEFGAVDGMPWVKPTAAEQILAAAAKVMNGSTGDMVDCGADIEAAMYAAIRKSSKKWTIIAGSLYLVSDVHKILGRFGDI